MLENGKVSIPNGTVIGSKAIYSCNSNSAFTIRSSKERICQSSENWSDEKIECGEGGKRCASF